MTFRGAVLLSLARSGSACSGAKDGSNPEYMATVRVDEIAGIVLVHLLDECCRSEHRVCIHAGKKGSAGTSQESRFSHIQACQGICPENQVPI
jgi:hypothetical protein